MTFDMSFLAESSNFRLLFFFYIFGHCKEFFIVQVQGLIPPDENERAKAQKL